MVGQPSRGGCWRRFVDVHDRRRTRPSSLAEPARPPISLAVGEPQHRLPAFVGPILAAHIDEFGRYPMNKGLDAFCEAAAAWLGRRFALPRPIDPASEVLVLNGSREGLFLAAIAAARW